MTLLGADGTTVSEKIVRTSLVAQYAQALLVLLVPAAVVWGTTYASIRAEIAGKASQAEVDEVKREQRVIGETLQKMERRQLVSFCLTFPQSFECQPSERK